MGLQQRQTAPPLHAHPTTLAPALYDQARRSSRYGGSRDSPKKVVINKRHDFAKLEREFITTDISLRELCRRHGITAHSLVTVQAKKRGWQEKRQAYRDKADESFIGKHAARHADRQAEISDKFLDAIDEAVTKFREDLRATRPLRQPDGSVTEKPAWYMTPRDLCSLIDRFQVLFERPSVISQHQGLAITSEISADVLREFIDATRGRGEASRMDVSPLPRTRRLDD